MPPVFFIRVIILILVAIDVGFMGLHAMTFLPPHLDSTLFRIDAEGGYAEIFGYGQWIGIICFLTFAAIKRRSWLCAAWVATFAYLFCDDFLQIHERVGAAMAGNINFPSISNMRPQGIGELIVSLVIGGSIITGLCAAYFFGDQSFKIFSRNMICLIGALGFFGVACDMLHSLVADINWRYNFIFSTIEDGGEMVVASLMCGYAALYAATPVKQAIWSFIDPVLRFCTPSQLLVQYKKGQG